MNPISRLKMKVSVCRILRELFYSESYSEQSVGVEVRTQVHILAPSFVCCVASDVLLAL